jgi:hypothetical protein
MIVEPRAALDRLIAALESHLAAASSGRGENDPAYTAAYATLIDAFETYDEALYDATGIDTPFVVYDEDGDDDEDYEEDDDELEIVIDLADLDDLEDADDAEDSEPDDDGDPLTDPGQP